MDEERLVTQLMTDEGFSKTAYKDTEGLWTIGFGRLIDDSVSGAGITPAEGRLLLRNNVNDTIKELDQKAKWWRKLPSDCQDALANMAFNLGWPRLSTFKNMLAALESGDYETAGIEAMDSKWANQVGDRAERIAATFKAAANKEVD